MTEIDDFAASLLDESKRFLERAKEPNADAEAPNLHAALMLAMCALEAHVNAVCDEVAKRTTLPHELGILLEKEVRLDKGAFKLDKKLKIFRLEDRIEFLHRRFGLAAATPNDWQSRLSGAIALRNDLTHPKSVPLITVAAVTQAIESVIETIDVLYRAIYQTPFAAASEGLMSSLEF